MTEHQIVRTGGSRAVQGCLIGAVLLFVVLLGAMIVLGYQQFRENTGEPTSLITAASTTGAFARGDVRPRLVSRVEAVAAAPAHG